MYVHIVHLLNQYGNVHLESQLCRWGPTQCMFLTSALTTVGVAFSLPFDGLMFFVRDKFAVASFHDEYLLVSLSAKIL